MTWNLRTTALLGTILLPVLAATGCTGTDVLTPGNGTVQFEVSVTNLNDSARFESISFTVKQVALRPLDPDADAALGPRDLALIQTDLTFNLAGTLFAGPAVPIPSGSYVVERLDLSSIRVRDSDGTGAPDTCASYLDEIPVPSPPQSPDINYQRETGDIDEVVTVNPNTLNTVNLVVDADRFIEALVSAWRCTSTNCSGGAPWCLGSSFLSFRFKLENQIDPYFDVE